MAVNIPVLTALAIGGSRCFDEETRAELKRVSKVEHGAEARGCSYACIEKWFGERIGRFCSWLFPAALLCASIVVLIDVFELEMFSGREYRAFSRAAWLVWLVFFAPSLWETWRYPRRLRQNYICGFSQKFAVGVESGSKPALVLFDRENRGVERRRLSLAYSKVLSPFTLTRILLLRDGTLILLEFGAVTVALFMVVTFNWVGEELEMMLAPWVVGGWGLLCVGALLFTVMRMVLGRARLLKYAATGACPSCGYAMGAVSINDVARPCSECGFELPFVLG